MQIPIYVLRNHLNVHQCGLSGLAIYPKVPLQQRTAVSYTPFTWSSNHQANIEQTSSKRRANIKQI